uniref:Glycosyltransferase n=1 Tax=Cajanus cajan TaxID=3821 RepID=A0A151STN7_CAJCA|nr:Anthocyanin 3'-O-beta-glucosyltransferase [Cajanus cajan]
MDPNPNRNRLKLDFIPFLAPGHLIPLCGLATLLASRGHHVRVITTPSNAQLLAKSNPSLHLHTVDFPAREAGLAHGVEIMSKVDDFNKAANFYRAAMLLRGPIARILEQQPPDCIVADFMYPWMDDVANNLNIPRLAFNGFSLFTVAAMDFAELDGEEYLEHYQKRTGHKAWHVGPACLAPRSGEERAEKSVVSENECLSWLDSKPPQSVVYICFGSMCRFPDKQLYEMACGLEQAGHAFIWVVPEKKGEECDKEEEKEMWLPKGFEERNKEKGLIIRGWAPQLLILGHAAVAAFLTHCGWNSTLEAVTAGVPMITWPVQGDQFYNEKLVSEVRGIGVEVGATEWRVVGYGEREKLIGRDCIERAVRRLMDGGEEALNIRRRAKEFGEKAKEALQEGGSSHDSLSALIAHLLRLRDSKINSLHSF